MQLLQDTHANTCGGKKRLTGSEQQMFCCIYATRSRRRSRQVLPSFNASVGANFRRSERSCLRTSCSSAGPRTACGRASAGHAQGEAEPSRTSPAGTPTGSKCISRSGGRSGTPGGREGGAALLPLARAVKPSNPRRLALANAAPQGAAKRRPAGLAAASPQ